MDDVMVAGRCFQQNTLCSLFWESAALRRLAAAIRFRHWPHFFDELTDNLKAGLIPFHTKNFGLLRLASRMELGIRIVLECSRFRLTSRFFDAARKTQMRAIFRPAGLVMEHSAVNRRVVGSSPISFSFL